MVVFLYQFIGNFSRIKYFLVTNWKSMSIQILLNQFFDGDFTGRDTQVVPTKHMKMLM